MGLPLDGIRILDLSRLLPGPYCTMLLADLGAEVIKVEDPVQGDYVRWTPPYIDKTGAMYLALNRNKKSITLNLKDPRGKEILLKLIEGADVLVEGNRPGVLDKLGVGYEKGSGVNPRIIYCALTGYGQHGPYSHRAGHDINYVGYTGVLSLNGLRGGRPLPLGVQVGDLNGAMGAVVGILAALMERERSGKGQFVDASLAAGAFSLLPLIVGCIEAGDDPQRAGETRLTGGIACYNTYETSDNRYVCLGAIEPKFFAKFCKIVGREDLEILHMGTGKDRDKLEEELQKLFRSRTSREWLDLLEDEDICFGPVKYPEEALDDPHVNEWGMVVETPLRDGRKMKQVALPFKLSRTQPGRPSTPPDIGQNTAEILGEIGIGEQEIEKLREENVVR